MNIYQTQALMKRFQDKPFLGKEEKHELATSLNISEKRVKEWFMNRRQERRKAGLLPNGKEY